MTCEVIRDLLPLCADGVASEESRAVVEEHIRACEACRTLYESMCAPVEVQATEVEANYMTAVKRQTKENRRFFMSVYGITLGLIVLLLLCWKGRDLLRTRVWQLDTISITAEQVEEEMPQALLTRQEKDLAKAIFSLPEVQDALEEGGAAAVGVSLPEELYRELMVQAGFDPDSVKHGYADVLGHTLFLDWYNEEYRCILEFIDADDSGHVDILRKSVTRRIPTEGVMTEIPHDVPIYTAEINAALIGTAEDELLENLDTVYERTTQKRDWLYFLKNDWE